MDVDPTEPRIAVYLDYENLAIGARDHLGSPFDFANVADALAERGRVIVRKAYADWSYFDADRRMLTRHQVELIDIPQKMGGSRKNAADIKMAIDAIELALERDYISTFVICTGDSDLSPLVQKLRELDRVFYDNLVSTPDDPSSDNDDVDPESSDASIVLSTLAGLEASSGPVRGSALKRAVLRKDPTFSESALGFRGFGALLKSLSEEGLVQLEGGNDPMVSMSGAGAAERADELLRKVVGAASSGVPLSGLKTAMRKEDPEFSERRLGYRNFGSYVQAAQARHLVEVHGEDDDRVVRLAGRRRTRRA
jgi:uncharacterized LabA/DUF88 family protein